MKLKVVKPQIFPLKIYEECYYAGMGEYEFRYVLRTSNNKLIAKDDYLKVDVVNEINDYIKNLEERIAQLELNKKEE
jgi:hypothetical protein